MCRHSLTGPHARGGILSRDHPLEWLVVRGTESALTGPARTLADAQVDPKARLLVEGVDFDLVTDMGFSADDIIAGGSDYKALLEAEAV